MQCEYKYYGKSCKQVSTAVANSFGEKCFIKSFPYFFVKDYFDRYDIFIILRLIYLLNKARKIAIALENNEVDFKNSHRPVSTRSAKCVMV